MKNTRILVLLLAAVFLVAAIVVVEGAAATKTSLQKNKNYRRKNSRRGDTDNNLILSAHASNETCFDDPTDNDCADFVYPEDDAEADMDNLCMHMWYMPGCTIERECKETMLVEKPHDESVMQYCDYFSVLADVCEYDMAGMGGCSNYVSLCAVEGTMVHQCSEYPSIPGLPTTKEANNYIKSMCGSHHMESCSKCNMNEEYMDCDVLLVYSELCKGMPNMPDCAAWSDMCDSIGTWPMFCPSQEEGEKVPSMIMYFHTGIVDYVLFKGWVPQNNGQYAGTLIAIIILSFLYQALLSFRGQLGYRWSKSAAAHIVNLKSTGEVEIYTGGEWLPPQPFRFKIELMRGLLDAFMYGYSLCLMLIAMSFNVGFFLALLAGTFLGSFFFQRYQPNGAYVSCCD